LTDMTVQTAEVPSQGRVILWDEASPVGLRITANGAKTFVVWLGKRRHTIGRYGDVTLSQARTAAKQLKAEQTLGRLVPSSRTVSDARAEYLKAVTVRPNTRRYYERNLHRLPDCRLAELHAADLNPILDALPSPARSQALKTYTAFFNWCIRRYYLDTSPCIRFRADKTVSRSRVLSDLEIGRIWKCLEPPAAFNSIVKLLLLTGQRRSEIAALRKEWICENRINLPKEITKNGCAHSFPIGILSATLLAKAPANSHSLLFPSTKNDARPFNGWWSGKITLDKTSGVSDWTLHDLRRTFATGLAELGVAPHVIERLLNHTTGTLSPIALVYNKARYLEEMRAAIELWEARLRIIVPGEPWGTSTT
jgi:integrase